MFTFDFFCGAGGLTRGFLDAGIKVIAGFDIDEDCRATYEYNNQGVKFYARDIREITASEIKEISGKESFNDTIFAGCAPCQPFSQQRKGERPGREARLLAELGRLTEEVKPGFVVVENVPGIARVNGNSTFKRFLKLLQRNGYRYTFSTIDAKYYGVPQTRRRLILVAARRVEPSLPKPKCEPSLRPFKTVRDTISKFPYLRAGSCHLHIPNHAAACITAINMERLKNTPHDGGDRRFWPEHLILKCHKEKGNGKTYKGHTDVYGRMCWDKPSPTLTGRCNSISNGRYGHPEQDRAISLREAAALQTFPDDYIFFGKQNHIALQIGNAVPVLLAKELGEHIRSMCNDDSNV